MPWHGAYLVGLAPAAAVLPVWLWLLGTPNPLAITAIGVLVAATIGVAAAIVERRVAGENPVARMGLGTATRTLGTLVPLVWLRNSAEPTTIVVAASVLYLGLLAGAVLAAKRDEAKQNEQARRGP
ncbi:MAG: hypothetical protein ACRCT8_18035 [Lacipirellulaceae bacterium]